MRVRVYTWQYHTDPLRLADEVNECIKSCENLGDTVVDADVLVRPSGGEESDQQYLVIIKYESNRRTYPFPDDRPGDVAEDEAGG
jgi:hypothetical protein